jgi:integration host factor subunit alpha
MTLTKARIVQDVSEIGFSKKKSAKIVECLLEILKQKIGSGEDILISGFGKFSTAKNGKRAAKGIPYSMDQLLTGGRMILFRCSPVLSKKINQRCEEDF